MKLNLIFLSAALLSVICYPANKAIAQKQSIHFSDLNQVTINDAFWSPKYELWRTVTANDVLDKFEGKHINDPKEQEANNAFRNFDLAAQGKKGIGKHAGPPWYDGLVYESIRGIADLLAQHPDKKLEQRLDNYIDRICLAQQTDPNGYLETYTLLMEPDHHWGENGGFLRWQHDVYNAGMLVEAGVHYYKATGKTKLLHVATRFANYMCSYMGVAPKRNVVPAHSGPEEAMMKLYWLYKNNPELKKKVGVPVHENDYYELAKFWIENRGNNCGYPLWMTWGNDKSEKWVKDQKYLDVQFGNHSRPSWGDYAQDSISVFNQKTIEGHAVRATLLATGVAATALENKSPKYIETAQNLWDNMVGKRMFITGGVGAIHNDEKFGPDYFLPTDAYLETCAAVGAGFFSQRMNELTGNGKYMDELERVLYNNVLTGISTTGVRYTYQNPLNADKHERWEWHGCPCCPPMFLKIVSALPQYIYAYESNKIYVNLFIGSETRIQLNGNNAVQIKQETQYPWNGVVAMTVNPEKGKLFSLKIRIPGWAQGMENPYGLYNSNLKSSISLKVNGQYVTINVVNGYTEISRKWKKGDKVELSLPMQPRIIHVNEQVANLKNMTAIASGPVIYCLENYDNAGLKNLKLNMNATLKTSYHKDILTGVNLITGKAFDENGKEVSISAIPYFAVGNRQNGGCYKVWLPEHGN